MESNWLKLLTLSIYYVKIELRNPARKNWVLYSEKRRSNAGWAFPNKRNPGQVMTNGAFNLEFNKKVTLKVAHYFRRPQYIGQVYRKVEENRNIRFSKLHQPATLFCPELIVKVTKYCLKCHQMTFGKVFVDHDRDPEKRIKRKTDISSGWVCRG